jgi:DNA-binding transcriptional regulator YiaG
MRRKRSAQSREDQVCELVPELVPEALIEFRKRMKLSQFGLAVRLGVPFSTIRSWERGWRKPRASAIALLSGVLTRKRASGS